MEIIKIIIDILISLFYYINYILLIKHFLVHFLYKNNKYQIMVTLWFDYTLIILILFIISLFHFFENFHFLNYSLIINMKKQIFLYCPLIYSNQIILNIILSIKLIFKLNGFKNKIVSNNNDCIYKIPYYFIKQLIIIIFEIIIIYYLKRNFSNSSIYDIINNFQSSLMITSIMMLLIILKKYKQILIFRKNFDSKNIEQKKYENNKNKVVEITQYYFYKNICDIIFNIPFIIFHTNKKFIKNYSDVLDCNQQFGKDFYLFHYSNIIFGFLYLYIFGIMLLNINYYSTGYIEKIFNIFFCVKKFHFNFGKGKNLIKNIKFNKNIKMDKIYYNSYFKDDSDININIIDLNKSFSESSNETDSSEDSSEKENNNKKNSIKYEYSECNYFIIYKLLYLYFKINKNVYIELEKHNENRISKIDNIITTNNNIETINNSQLINSINDNDEEIKNKNSFKSFYHKRNKGIALNVNIRYNSFVNIKEKIDNIKKIIKRKKLIYSKKFSLNELFANIEDKIMKKFFLKHIYNNLYKKEENFNISNTMSTIKEKDELLFNNSSEFLNFDKIKRNNQINVNEISEFDEEINFSIKSLTNDSLFDLNPYYNLNIKDIIKFLNKSNNMDLFSKFSEEKLKNELYNNYYTKDSLLSLEIYNKELFDSKNIKSFISDYKDYLLDKISNFSYSFLPLIIGIFNIRYLSYDKIIILYRNPLTFSYNMNFNYWLKFTFNDIEKKIETSNIKENMLNLNDLEISNNLLLEKNEYKNTLDILDNDLFFLKNSSKFNMNLKLNIFILNNEYKNNIDIGQSLFSSTNPNINENNVNQVLDNIMRESLTSFPYNDYNYKEFNFQKKYFGSDDVCLLEKLYVNELDNNRYIFKIYFNNIFDRKFIDNSNKSDKNKKNNNINDETINFSSYKLNDVVDEEKKNNIINNNKYCQILKNNLIRHIKQSTNDIFDEKL